MKKGKIFLAISAVFAANALALASPVETRPPAIARTVQARFDSLHDFDVTSYRLWIRLPFNNDSLYGHIRMGAVSNIEGLSTIKLNAADMAVDSAFCDGQQVSFLLSADTLRLSIPAHSLGQNMAADIFYRLGGRASRRGYYWYPKGYNSGTLHAVAYAMSEPQDARYWMPCYDEPWDKADSGCVFYVAVPDSYQVAGNGLLRDTLRDGGFVTWHWEEPHPIATYLMCFTASRFSIWSDSAATVSGAAVPLSYFVWPEDSALSRSVFATVPAMVRLLDSTFGVYPFQKYGMAAVYPFSFGGMEHQTMTTIHRNWILSNSQTGILHELAHMWFGDLVTCGTWADIWLNEGFASYLQVYYDAWLGGQEPGVYMKQRFSSALSGNANSHPIYNPPPNLLFDYSMEYAKGAWVVHMLRWVLGDDVFFPMIRAYLDSLAYKNAVTADLQSIAEEHYGSDLSWFFHQWLMRPGHPRYATAAYYSPDSLSARVKIYQTSIDGQPYQMPLALACSTAAGIGSQAVVWDSMELAGDFLVTSAQPIKKVLLDPEDWILKEWADSLPHLAQLTVRYDPTVVVVSWNRFGIDSTIAGYHVYRSTNPDSGYERRNSAIVTDTAYIDSNVYSCIPWYYRVTAVSGEDTGCQTHFSNVLSCLVGGAEGEPNSSFAANIFSAGQALPNPFRSTTAIQFQLPAAGRAVVRIYNVIGQPVKTLWDGWLPAGRQRLVWDGGGDSGAALESGIYFCQIQTGRNTAVRRMVKIR